MKRAVPFLVALLLILVLGPRALSAATVDTTADEDVDCAASLSYVGTAVQEVVKAWAPTGHSELTTCNQVPPSWLHYLPPGTAIPGYFDHVADEIAATTSQIEISTLHGNIGSSLEGSEALGDDRMERIADGIRRLNERTVSTTDRRKPLVRILTGMSDAEEVYEAAIADLPENAPWNVQVLAMNIGDPFFYWNHSKTSVRDRCVVLSGSVESNSEAEMYMEARGDAAAAAERFFESVWATSRFPLNGDCAPSGSPFCKQSCIRERCWERTIPPLPACPIWTGGARSVFSLGRGNFEVGAAFDHSADAAIFAALASANEQIVILQRSTEFRPAIPNYVQLLYRTLAEAIARGVEVRVMVGGGNVFHSSPEEVAEHLGQVMDETFLELGLSAAERREAHRRLLVGRVNSHAKVFMIDGQAFYVGSQNFYPTGLQEPTGEASLGLYEQGFLVDDAGLTGELAEQLAALWADATPYLQSQYVWDGTYDTTLWANGSGAPGSGWCIAELTVEIDAGNLLPQTFQCIGEFNGNPLVVDGYVDGQFGVTAAGFGLISGDTPQGGDTTIWYGEAADTTFYGSFSDLQLGVSYQGSFVGTFQP